MANDKNFKIKNGLLAGRYLGSNGTETAGSGPAYDLSVAEYDGVSFSVAAQESAPRGISFKPDGTKMYMVGQLGDDVNEYDLSTAWDISTASFSQNFSVAAQEANPIGLFFKPDGTKMYVIGTTGDDVNEYNLSTAWDVSTASYLQNFSVAAQENAPIAVFFKPDGTKMYICGFTGDDVNEYDLSTAWDISTASFLQLFSVSAQDSLPTALFFKSDGTKMYVLGDTNDNVNEYNLSTAWDISTASFNQTFYFGGQCGTAYGLFFKPDGTQMFISGQTPASIFSYSTVSYTQTLDLSTGTTFSFTPSGATTVSLTNAPTSGKAVGFAVEINGDGSAITWPTSVKWSGGVAPVASASKELYALVTTDGGTTYYGRKAAEELA